MKLYDGKSRKPAIQRFINEPHFANFPTIDEKEFFIKTSKAF